MVIEWKERGHEVEDHQDAQSSVCVNSLRDYRLLKFFQTLSRNQSLKWPTTISDQSMGCWSEIFIIGDEELELEVDDIYFINVLSRIGERVQLFGSHGGDESTNTLIRRHCSGVETTVSGKVKIETIKNLPLRKILHTMDHLVGVHTLHEILKSQFKYIVDCLAPTVFDQYKGVLVNMKWQLTKGKLGNLKQFVFGWILVNLFLESVPLL